jgi:hypothetical protein
MRELSAEARQATVTAWPLAKTTARSLLDVVERLGGCRWTNQHGRHRLQARWPVQPCARPCDPDRGIRPDSEQHPDTPDLNWAVEN